MAGYSIKIKGLDKLKNNFNNSDVKSAINNAIKKSFFTMESEVKKRTPVDTGSLRQGWNTVLGTLWGMLINVVYYGIYVEQGTRKMTGRFFLRDGVKRATPKINKYFTEALEKIIVKISKN